MAKNIEGKVVVITGASSGIGEAVAEHLAAEGASVVLGARRADRLAMLVEEIRKAGGKAEATATDVTKRSDVQQLIETATTKFGRIDVLVNNAGVMPLSALEKLKVDEWEQMIDVNIKGVLYGIAAALPLMQAQQSGHIINVSSVAGHKTRATSAVYSATKFAVRALSEGLRQEVGPNIRTTIISPGAISTELGEHITDQQVAEAMKQFTAIAIPPDSIARAIAYAISEPPEVDVNEIIVRPTAQEH